MLASETVMVYSHRGGGEDEEAHLVGRGVPLDRRGRVHQVDLRPERRWCRARCPEWMLPGLERLDRGGDQHR